MTETVIRKSILLRAAPAKVWAFLTDPDKLAIWFHRPTTPLLDGPYEMQGAESGERFMWGDVLVAEPFKRLEYTFELSQMGGVASMVKWTLTEGDAGVTLSLEHSGLPQGAVAYDLSLALDKGWEDHMGQMRSALHM